MEKILLLYIPAAVGIVLVAEPAIRIVFGGEYLAAVPVLQLFAVFVVVRAIHKITGNGLDFLGLARVRAIARGCTAVGNVALNLVLIPQFGIVGAAIATLVTYTAYTAVNVYYIHRELSLRLGYLLGQAGRITVIALLMGGVVSLVTPHVASLATLLVAIGTGIFVWAVLSVVSGLLDPTEVRSFLA
jgi:O-antigen/teichoic acid export membrane protein